MTLGGGIRPPTRGPPLLSRDAHSGSDVSITVPVSISTAPTGQPPCATWNFIADSFLLPLRRAGSRGHAGLAPDPTETAAAVLPVAWRARHNRHPVAD